MRIEKLKELMEYNIEFGKHLLTKDGKLFPVAFMICENDMGIIPLSFKDENEKDIQVKILRELGKAKNADAIFMMTESWYVTTKNKEELGTDLSKHPMRKECILVIGECEYGRIAIIQIFERKNDEIIFGEKIYMDRLCFTRFDFGLKDKKISTDPTLN